MSGGFAVSRKAGRALMGVCIVLPAAALVVRFRTFDPAKPYEENLDRAQVLDPPHVPLPTPQQSS